MVGNIWRLRPVLAALALLSLAGCVSVDRSVELAEANVTAIPAGDGHLVSARTLAKAMLEAGFTNQQILRDGPDVASDLASVGGAQVRYGKVTAALFAVRGNTLYVSSSRHGTFLLPLGPTG